MAAGTRCNCRVCGDTIAIEGAVKSGEKAVEKPASSLANGALVTMAAK